MPNTPELNANSGLAKLAQRHAYAVFDSSSNGRLVVLLDQSGAHVVIGSLDATEHLAAVAAGFIECRTADGTWHLTQAGRNCVRRARVTRETIAASASPQANAALAIAPEKPQVNDAESPLAWLRSRLDKQGQPMISAEQFDAGERLRADLWRARMTPRVTASWSGIAQSRSERRGAPDHSRNMADTQVAASQRVERAFKAVGPEHIDVLFDVCGHLKGLEQVERDRGLPQRSAKHFLQLALTALARHYGLLPAPDVDARIRRHLRHWGAPDYRPALEPRGS